MIHLHEVSCEKLLTKIVILYVFPDKNLFFLFEIP